ncbi:MAG TPA: cytidine deaminase [Xenococcaceae cyanobacterium]|jgi:cytidine deaminase
MNPPILSESQKKQLINAAAAAWKKAYAPYSQFQVGAALLSDQGKIYTGCNVENASYGLSICAERNAIATAIAAEGAAQFTIKAIAIANNRQIPCSPCGACRQVIAEFSLDTSLIFLGAEGYQTCSISQLLPQEFSLADRR